MSPTRSIWWAELPFSARAVFWIVFYVAQIVAPVVGTGEEPAHQTPGLNSYPSEQELRRLDDEAWEFVARSRCADLRALSGCTAGWESDSCRAWLQQELARRAGVIALTPAGRVIARKKLFMNARYRIEWIRASNRVPGVSVFGYLATPIGGSRPHPGVVLLHGARVPPHTPLGGVLPVTSRSWATRAACHCLR